jgi:membrane dipeptidase
MELCLRIIKGTENVNSTWIIDHITHIADTGGIDCVGLGSDFDGIPLTPTDLRDVSCFSVLAEGLKDRGFNQTEIRKIMGLNLLNFIQNYYKK